MRIGVISDTHDFLDPRIPKLFAGVDHILHAGDIGSHVVNLIPPRFRPRVVLRFDAQNALLVSGLLDGGSDIAQRPVVVDVPVGQGHVVLFANNPIYRGETIGSYALVFNAILNCDSLDAGRKLDAK